MLVFDASVYYINWKDIQVSAVADSLFGYVANAGKAKSQGTELSATLRPVPQFKLSAWVAFTDSVLTANFPGFPTGPVYGRSGDRLPDTSRFSGNLGMEREFLLSTGVTGFVGGDIRYVGDHIGQFIAGPSPRQYFSPYAQTNVHAGVRYETWTANLYGNNVTDKRGVLAGGIGTYPPFAFTYIQPCTVGLSLTKTF
jgi:outer membrane receptor protein involved in Fe transport